MRTTDLDNLLRRFNRNPGAAAEHLRQAAEALALPLPSEYAAFLRESNGGEGMIGENYVMLWKAEELAGLNASYEVKEYAPGLLLIGSDGGGEAFAFDTRATPWSVVKVPFVGMETEHVDVMADSFDAFLRELAR